jgi:hypothetical protein
MRHEDAGLALWLASDHAGDERRSPCQAAAQDLAPARVTLRQRAGATLIAFGERLAGEPRRRTSRGASRRPLAGQAS